MVSQQQSATSSTRRVAPNTHKSLSHAPSGSASHGNCATQSSSGAQASHHDQPSSQAHGNIRSGNTRNTTSTNHQVVVADNIDDTHNTPIDDAATDADDDGDASDASNTNAGIVV